ncbi:hypothetical protein [Ignatzschineria sp. LJL83]
MRVLKRLKLVDISNDNIRMRHWSPLNEDVDIIMKLIFKYDDVGPEKQEVYYCRLLTPEAAFKGEKNQPCFLIEKRGFLIISHYDYKELRNSINKILKEAHERFYENPLICLDKYFYR